MVVMHIIAGGNRYTMPATTKATVGNILNVMGIDVADKAVLLDGCTLVGEAFSQPIECMGIEDGSSHHIEVKDKKAEVREEKLVTLVKSEFEPVKLLAGYVLRFLPQADGKLKIVAFDEPERGLVVGRFELHEDDDNITVTIMDKCGKNPLDIVFKKLAVIRTDYESCGLLTKSNGEKIEGSIGMIAEYVNYCLGGGFDETNTEAQDGDEKVIDVIGKLLGGNVQVMRLK